MLRRAAEQGDPKAQTNLAIVYAKGERVKKVYADEAIGLFHKAAKQDYANAKLFLGLMSAIGQGVKRDYAEAVTWYQAAADQGHIDAQLTSDWSSPDSVDTERGKGSLLGGLLRS